MRVYRNKCYLLICLFFMSCNTFAIDCESEKEFLLPKAHWLNDARPELQYYVVFYLSSKNLHECINEALPSDRQRVRTRLMDVIGEQKLLSVESEVNYLFDTKVAFESLGIDVFDDAFLLKLRSYEFTNLRIYE